MPFDQPTRNRLARFVADARALLTQEFTRQLQNDFGLDPERGAVTELTRLGHLDEQRLETARILRATLVHYSAGTPKPTAKSRQEALERIVREQAFTVLNRLAALRMAEARGLLIESIGQGYRSRGFQLYARLAGPALGETGDAYRSYLFSLFDEFSVDLAVLFDRFSPQGRLFPRESALLHLLELINHPEIDPLWGEDETIGWVYQYFNSQEERRQMRAESQAPRNSRELAVRNQFFTPRYVVEFLADNTLGRIWYEMTKGQTRLVDECRYLVRRPNEIFLGAGEEVSSEQSAVTSGDDDLSQEELLRQPVYIPHRPLKDPREIRMLDPACGSMHFGLYAFDLFQRIYEEAWEMEAAGLLSVGSQQSTVTSQQSSVGASQATGHRSLVTDYPTLDALRRAVPHLIIEHNIHGIDIDPRAVQIAGLSLWLRAQRSWQEQGVKAQERPRIRRAHIVCAEPMPGDKALLEEFLAELREERLESLIRQVIAVPENQRVRATPSMADALAGLIRTVWAEMELAGEAGSLLKIEESLTEAIERGRAEWDEKLPLFRVETFRMTGGEEIGPPKVNYLKVVPGEEADFWDRAEGLVLAALEAYAQRAENGRSYARRLFAGDAARGFAFIDLCRRRYDVVLMNPPFGEASTPARTYLYASTSEAARDLFAGFVSRFVQRLANQGLLGVLSNRTAFFSDFLSSWRLTNLLGQESLLIAAADIGYGVLDALVEAAAYVCAKTSMTQSIVMSSLDSTDKESSLIEQVLSISNGASRQNVYVRDLRTYLSFPDYRILYQIHPFWIEKLNAEETHPLFTAKAGLTSGNDMRHLRLHWEVPAQFKDIRWKWIAKGGEFSRYRTDLHLVIDWQNSEFLHRTRNSDLYGKPGVTYTERTTSNLSARVLNEGSCFSGPGPGIIPANDNLLGFLLAYMNSFIASLCIEFFIGGGDFSVKGTAARHLEPGYMRYLPATSIDEKTAEWFTEKISMLLVHLDRLNHDETDALFLIPLYRQTLNITAGLEADARTNFATLATCYSIISALETEMAKLFQIPVERITDAYSDTGWPWPVDNTIDSGTLQSIVSISALEPRTINSTTNLPQLGYRFETKLSHYLHAEVERVAATLRLSPIALCQFLSRQAEPSQAALLAEITSVLSISIGLLVGRWDIRLSGEQSAHYQVTDPFAPLPVCPPGMLQNAAGLPAGPGDVPADYPLRISWPGILVDDPGHLEDMEGRVREALQVIWPENADAIEQEACQIKASISASTILWNRS